MSRKIIYFINPVAGTKKKGQLLKLIKEKTSAQNIPFEIINTNPQQILNQQPSSPAASAENPAKSVA